MKRDVTEIFMKARREAEDWTDVCVSKVFDAILRAYPECEIESSRRCSPQGLWYVDREAGWASFTVRGDVLLGGCVRTDMPIILIDDVMNRRVCEEIERTGVSVNVLVVSDYDEKCYTMDKEKYSIIFPGEEWPEDEYDVDPDGFCMADLTFFTIG